MYIIIFWGGQAEYKVPFGMSYIGIKPKQIYAGICDEYIHIYQLYILCNRHTYINAFYLAILCDAMTC